MFQVIFFVFIVLLCLFIVALITIGSCIGMAHLMIYFMPTITLGNVLVPAAILTTVLIVMFGGLLKLWFIDGVKRNAPIIFDYEEDEGEEVKSKSSTVTRINPHRNDRNRR